MPVPVEELERAVAEERTLNAVDADFDRIGTRYSGKVRENFSHDGQRTIIVTDRVSAFDVVLGTIPFKGQVLNQIARYWFERTSELFPNHLVDVPDPQVTRAVECEPIPVEFVCRGYLTGVSGTSIWRAYERGDRTFCGHELPDGLVRHQKLPENILTPSTKAPKGGHDESVSKAELVARGAIGAEELDALEARVLALFARGQELAAERGLILVDTKYELGRRADGEVVLIDEIHTPDSSRYWYADSYQAAMAAGEDPRSMDKEYVRRWLVSQGFSGDGAPPALTPQVRVEAARRYIETFETVTGQTFVPAPGDPATRIKGALGLA